MEWTDIRLTVAKADADNANVLTAANALASLQADALDGVKETVQYEITA